MSDQKQPESKPERVLKADCTQEELGLFKWASSRKKGWGLADFLREALEEKVEAEAADFERNGGVLQDWVRDGIANMKAKRIVK